MATSAHNSKRLPVRVAAIIPARGGKQSVPYKNLQKLGGKTLLTWAVEVAFAAREIDAVVVSTEDARIARAARRLGAVVAPRPKKYAQPSSGDAGFYHHAVTWMERRYGWRPALLVNLRPTSPLRFARDIDRMVLYLKRHPRVDGMKSVVPAPLHPYKMWHLVGHGKIGTAGRLRPLADFDTAFRHRQGPDKPRQRVQRLFPVFFQDGQIDITRRRLVLRPQALRYDNVWGARIHGYVLDPRTSVDLDEPDDFIRAAKLYRALQRSRRGKERP